MPHCRFACPGLPLAAAGEGEFRELGVDEMATLKSAGMPGASLLVRDLDAQLLVALMRKGLVYLEVSTPARSHACAPDP